MNEFQRSQRVSQKKGAEKRIFIWIFVPLLIVVLSGAGYATFYLIKLNPLLINRINQ